MRVNENTIRLSYSEEKSLGFRICNGEIEDYDKHCPAKFKYRTIDGNYPPSELMLRGVVLESNLIGASRNDAVMELPLLKNGEHSVHMHRIWKHKESFERYCKENNIYIGPENVQMPALCEYPHKVDGNRVILTCVFDVCPVIINDEVSIMDIKYYSGNIQKDSYFDRRLPITHDSCYHDDANFSTTQAVQYRYIFSRIRYDWLLRYFEDNGVPKNTHTTLITEASLKKMQEKLLPFYWYIFTTSKFEKPEEQQFIKPYVPMAGEFQVLEELIRRAAERFLEWESLGFPERYNEYDCKSCDLRSECKTYLTHKDE